MLISYISDFITITSFPLNILLFQEADTENIFYGLDDIDGQSDIIIVCILPSVEIMLFATNIDFIL